MHHRRWIQPLKWSVLRSWTRQTCQIECQHTEMCKNKINTLPSQANTFYKPNAFFMLLNVGRVGVVAMYHVISVAYVLAIFFIVKHYRSVYHIIPVCTNSCSRAVLVFGCMWALILLFSCFLCGLLHHAGKIWLDFRWSPESGLKWTNILQFKYEQNTYIWCACKWMRNENCVIKTFYRQMFFFLF